MIGSILRERREMSLNSRLIVQILLGRARYFFWCLRVADLRRGMAFQVGPGAAIRISKKAIFNRKKGLVFRRGLTLVVDGSMTCGSDVFFNRDAYISVKKKLVIGNGVRFGERVSIHDADHKFEPLPLSASDAEAYDCSDISIGDRVWVGANVVILRGSIIGDDVVVAAGSVVKGKIPGGVLVAGAPAKVMRALAKKQ